MNERTSTVYRYIDNLGMEYKKVEHSPAATIEECSEIEKIIDGKICKNLLLRTANGKVHYLLILRNDKRFVTGEISKKLGSSRLSFVSGEEMQNLVGTCPGSLSILSLIFDKEKSVSLAIDEDVFADEYFCCHPCDNTATLKFKTEDIKNKFLPSLGVNPVIIKI